MSMLKTLLKLCFLFRLISQAMATGRKYDLEVEAQRLYGEDFKSVLRRFRRTPDYLKILNDKMHDLKVYVKEMSLQVLHYYHGKMSQRVSDIVGVTRNYNDDQTTPPPVYYHAFNARRQEPEDTNKKGIKQLDDYMAFNHALTVTERNSFKDLGFEFAGNQSNSLTLRLRILVILLLFACIIPLVRNLIHSIIHNMGPVEAPPKSTRMIGQESDKLPPTTTEHPHTHEVTADSTVGHTLEDETTPETFRFRSQWDKVESFFRKWQ